MSDPLQVEAEALAKKYDLDPTALLEPPKRRGRPKKAAAPVRRRRVAGLISHESHVEDIPKVAAELGLPPYTVRAIVQGAFHNWQRDNPVLELVRRHFAVMLAPGLPTSAE